MTEPKYSLEEIRTRLNELDDQLLRLLSERRQMSLEVAKSKVQTAKPVRDAEREQQLLANVYNFPGKRGPFRLRLNQSALCILLLLL